MFTNRQNFTNQISTNDLDLLVHQLCEEIIAWNSTQTNFNTDYVPNIFRKGKVIDNWGVDLFIGDNLQELQNDLDTEYMLTYRRDNTTLYNNCNFQYIYDFSFSVKDCQNGRARLNSLADLFIESIIKNTNTYIKTISTRFSTATSTLIENRKYSISLEQCEVEQRLDCMEETIQSKSNQINFLTNFVKIKLKIHQL